MASFCCNVVVDGIVFSSGMFIDPISESFGASKASVALVGSLLSGFYLIIGPFVSGNFDICHFWLVDIQFTTFYPHSTCKPLWLPKSHDVWICLLIRCLCAMLLCTECLLLALILRCFGWHRVLLYLHAFGHHCWLLLWKVATTCNWYCFVWFRCWLLHHGSNF